MKDIRGWIYMGATTLYVGVVMAASLQDALTISVIILFPLPVFMGFIEALFMGSRLMKSGMHAITLDPGTNCDPGGHWPLCWSAR
jgi:hypothetical protein